MNILLTGDDGYNSIGTRLLIHFLKKDHTLTIAGTKTQQSAVGGRLSIKHGGTWFETIVDGVQAFCIDGSPADALEFSHVKFPHKFDLILSGVNLGENVGVGIFSSGTVCAAWRGLGLEVATHSVALSWVTPPDFYFHAHDANESITEFIENPGKMVKETIDIMFKQQFWNSKFLNINFPSTYTESRVFTRLTPSIKECYPPLTINEQTNEFSYPFTEVQAETTDSKYDIVNLHQGKISITPMSADWTDDKLYTSLKQGK
ncbi:MAG: 5'/3'-nucleotidase SurE [Candidatus Woesebacteria bacterium]